MTCLKFIRFILQSRFHGTSTFWDESVQNSIKFSFINWVKLSFFSNFVQKLSIVWSQMNDEFSFKFRNLRSDHLVKISSDTCKNNTNLFFSYHWNLNELIRNLRIVFVSKVQLIEHLCSKVVGWQRPNLNQIGRRQRPLCIAQVLILAYQQLASWPWFEQLIRL